MCSLRNACGGCIWCLDDTEACCLLLDLVGAVAQSICFRGADIRILIWWLRLAKHSSPANCEPLSVSFIFLRRISFCFHRETISSFTGLFFIVLSGSWPSLDSIRRCDRFRHYCVLVFRLQVVRNRIIIIFMTFFRSDDFKALSICLCFFLRYFYRKMSVSQKEKEGGSQKKEKSFLYALLNFLCVAEYFVMSKLWKDRRFPF